MLIRYEGEQQLSQLTLGCNTADGGLFSNVAANCAKGLTLIPLHQPAVICGGGPSLADSLENIRDLQKAGAKIYALNNVAKFLFERGIKADAQVLLDPRPRNIEFIDQPWAGELLLCSQAHPSLADKCLEIGYPVRLWHPSIDGIAKYLKPGSHVVGASLTVGLSAMCLVHTFGHHEIHLFGYDSSNEGDSTHAYKQAADPGNEIVRCAIDNQVFYASTVMAGQINQFKDIAGILLSEGCEMFVHGRGAIPALWKAWRKELAQKVLTAVYDLGVSPPSYDFLSFLIEAERHRKANGFTDIDIVFQPGPMHGFRDDDIPPDPEARKGMLWRICVGMARLLPSVRNIDVKAVRWNVTGDVFPVGYTEKQPVAHYATKYLKGGEPILKASEAARRQIATRFSKPYATISIRQAPYWTDRNSDRWEWAKVANWLKANGIQPVIVPDTDGTGLDAYGEYQEFQAASFDIDLRAALYEGAIINLGVLNGPMSLLAYLDARYLICKVVVETAIATTVEFLRAHGYEKGDDFGGNGKFVWEKDNAETIIRELKEFEVQSTEKTS